MGRHVAQRSPRPTRPARRVVVLAALSIATFACSPQASDAPATAEAPPVSAGATESLAPPEGFTVEGEPLDEPTSGPGVRSWVEGDDELDGDLVAAPVQPTAERPPAPNSRPDAPSPASPSSPGAAAPSPTLPAPVAPSTTPASPATTSPTSPAPTTDAPTTSSPTTSAPPAPGTILASADAIIAASLEDGLITAGTAVALSAKVDTALAALATGGPTTSACGAIGALLGLLAAQDGKDVPTALADQLTAVVLAASAALAC